MGTRARSEHRARRTFSTRYGLRGPARLGAYTAVGLCLGDRGRSVAYRGHPALREHSFTGYRDLLPAPGHVPGDRPDHLDRCAHLCQSPHTPAQGAVRCCKPDCRQPAQRSRPGHGRGRGGPTGAFFRTDAAAPAGAYERAVALAADQPQSFGQHRAGAQLEADPARRHAGDGGQRGAHRPRQRTRQAQEGDQ